MKLLAIIVALGGFTAPLVTSEHIPLKQVEERGDVPYQPMPGARCPQHWQTAVNVGWTQTQLSTLDYLMWRESRCKTGLRNADDPNGGSFGIVQVNGFWVKWLRERGVLKQASDLYKPEVNLLSALFIYNYADNRYQNGWGPWNL